MLNLGFFVSTAMKLVLMTLTATIMDMRYARFHDRIYSHDCIKSQSYSTYLTLTVRQPSEARTGVGQQRLTRRAAVVNWKCLSAVHFKQRAVCEFMEDVCSVSCHRDGFGSYPRPLRTPLVEWQTSLPCANMRIKRDNNTGNPGTHLCRQKQ